MMENRDSPSIKANYIYNTFYQVLAIVVPLVTTPYITRILGAEGIGEYAYAYSVATYFFMVCKLGIDNYGRRTIAFSRSDRSVLSKAFCSLYAMQIITSLFAIGIYVVYILHDTRTTMSRILVLYVISGMLDISWFFFGLEQFKFTVIRNTIIKLLTTVFLFLFVRNGDGKSIYGYIMAGGYLVSSIALWPYVYRFVDFSLPSLQEVASHFKGNLVLFVPFLAVSLYKTMDKIMLGNMTSSAQVGLYEAAEKIIRVPVALISSLGSVMMPRVSVLISEGKKEECEKYFERSLYFACFLATSISFGIMGVGREFVPFFYGAGFDECIGLYNYLLPSCVFLGISNVLLTQYIIPNNYYSVQIISVSSAAIVNFVMNSILIPRMQASGAAVGTLLAEMTVMIIEVIAIYKKTHVLKYMRNCIPAIVSGILMYITLNQIRIPVTSALIAIIVKAVIGLSIYVVLFFVQILIMRHIGLGKMDALVNEIPSNYKRIFGRLKSTNKSGN